jgi:hypothetical protein
MVFDWSGRFLSGACFNFHNFGRLVYFGKQDDFISTADPPHSQVGLHCSWRRPQTSLALAALQQHHSRDLKLTSFLLIDLRVAIGLAYA